MKQFNKISDEELAAYMENMLSSDDFSQLSGEMDLDTFEVLKASRRAIDEMPSKTISLPPWTDVAGCSGFNDYNNACCISADADCSSLPMAGFLGEEDIDNEDIDDDIDPYNDNNEEEDK